MKQLSQKSFLEESTTIRILLNAAKGVFAKSYNRIFTHEIFKVAKVVKTTPILYYMEDLDGEPILGIAYRAELKPTNLHKKI